MSMKSGYLIRVGTENKDLITECTAQEFRDWMKEKGFPIDFISDRTLDAEELSFRYRIRYAFLLDLQTNTGIKLVRVKDDYETFIAALKQEGAEDQ